MVRCRIHKSLAPIPTLCQINPVHALRPVACNPLQYCLPFKPSSSKCTLTLQFATTILYSSLLSTTRDMSRLYHSLFYLRPLRTQIKTRHWFLWDSVFTITEQVNSPQANRTCQAVTDWDSCAFDDKPMRFLLLSSAPAFV